MDNIVRLHPKDLAMLSAAARHADRAGDDFRIMTGRNSIGTYLKFKRSAGMWSPALFDMDA